MGKRNVMRLGLILGTALSLAACQEGTKPFGFLKSAPKGEEGTEAPAQSSSTRIVERDVEAPEVFSADEQGLWDGRPSLGGVWVAHPSVKDPERVIIRNPGNGKFVIGALFRRERDNPGPQLQVSSDAAAALDLLAGAPTKLSVVALRREEAAPEPEAQLVTDPVIAAPEAIGGEKIEAKSLDEVTKTAAGALAKADATAPATPAAKPAAAAPAPAPAKPAAAPAKAPSGKLFVQIGIFSVEANAQRAADQMGKSGVVASVKKEESQGKTFWRVLAGPAASAADRDALIKKIKGLGYPDAYAVSK